MKKQLSFGTVLLALLLSLTVMAAPAMADGTDSNVEPIEEPIVEEGDSTVQPGNLIGGQPTNDQPVTNRLLKRY